MVQIANTTALGQNSAKPVWHQQPHCSDPHGPGAVPHWNQFCLILLCLCAFLSFASLQYLIDELSSQGLLLSYSSKKKLCDKHRIRVCDLQSLGSVGLSPVLVRSMCGSTCKSGASRAWSTAPIRLTCSYWASPSSPETPLHCVSGVPSTSQDTPRRGHRCMAEF